MKPNLTNAALQQPPKRSRAKALIVAAGVAVILLGLGMLATSSHEVAIDVPSMGKPYKLHLRIPRLWKVELGGPEGDPRVARMRFKQATRYGGPIGGIDHRWPLLEKTWIPGVAAISYSPNKEGLPLEQFVRLRRASWHPVDSEPEELRPLRGTTRIVRRVTLEATHRAVLNIVYLWKPGYGGVCEVCTVSDRYTPERILREQERMLRSAHLEEAR